MKTKRKTTFLYFLVSCTLVLFCVLFTFPLETTYGADTLDKKYDELEQLQEKADKYQGIIDLKRKEKETITTQIQSLEIESKTVEEDITENEQEIDKIASEIEKLEKEITTKEENISDQKEFLSYIVRAHYESKRDQSPATLLFSGGGNNILTKNDRVAQTSVKMKEIIDNLNTTRDTLLENRNSLSQKKTHATDLTDQLEKRNDYLESSQSYKATLVAEAIADEKKYVRKLSSVEEEQREIQREIESIEFDKVGDFSYKDLPSRNEADFDDPVRPRRITQGYGKTNFSQSTSWYSSHNGVDFGNAGSKKIMAAADGKVIATGDSGNYAYGKWIAIDHKNGLVTMYGHLSKIKAKRSKSVDQGDEIGTMGTTGYSTGVHLHFTVFVESTFEIVNSSRVSGVKIPVGASVNPMQYL